MNGDIAGGESVALVEEALATLGRASPDFEEVRRSLDFMFENLKGAEEALDAAFSEHATKLARILGGDGNVLERLTAIATSLAMTRLGGERREPTVRSGKSEEKRARS